MTAKQNQDRRNFAEAISNDLSEELFRPVAERPAPIPAAIPSKKRGRPPKLSKMTIEEAENAITSHLPQLLDRLNDLAMGVLVQVIESTTAIDPITGEEVITPVRRIYQRPPDKDALKYLTERVLGRVPQRVELSGKIEETFKVVPWMPRDEAEQRKLASPLVSRVIAVTPVSDAT